ncbi:MAG: hypothetical protein EPN43_01285 [Jatrophihabitans sp.]|nr:MAG: hypothetical protein EPN43_01285 [Jatrophihabitans sp.]
MSSPAQARPYRVSSIEVLAVGALVAALVGGVYIAGRVPHPVNLALGSIPLVAALLLLVAAASLLARLPSFAWWRFRQVAGWTLLVYLVIAGMIEYVIIYDGTRGGVLAVITALLVVFALDVPMLLGYSVARFERAH